MPTLGCSNEGEVRTIPRALTRDFQFLYCSILQFPADYGADYRLIDLLVCGFLCNNAMLRPYNTFTIVHGV